MFYIHRSALSRIRPVGILISAVSIYTVVTNSFFFLCTNAKSLRRCGGASLYFQHSGGRNCFQSEVSLAYVVVGVCVKKSEQQRKLVWYFRRLAPVN